ncbi:MAG: hypothetical protein NZM10_03305 [Fimbriimonadales bacterium]|nr:hypothetical protein [Fimbriimonadales bacterium]
MEKALIDTDIWFDILRGVLVSANTRHYQRIVEAGFPLCLANWRE